ncbi:hypothetical protein GGX14DRAFT_562964 [Mycena pura]|uniref:Uncharacterized protein n=1 Tax=Mycena pura TaxID=153505 RepID=A0AAD6YD96_9AGAR|nr:hypothetical protein GGX14DRAFT_562964 [Mycena pura]
MKRYPSTPTPAQQQYGHPSSYPGSAWPTAPPPRRTPVAHSASAVWGGSTAGATHGGDWEDVDDGYTVAARTDMTAPRARVPGTGRRVAEWVHDAGAHAPEFRSPFRAPAGTSKSGSHSSSGDGHGHRDHGHRHHQGHGHGHGHGHHASDRHRDRTHQSHHPHRTQREPPPVWIPAPPTHSRHASAQQQYAQQPQYVPRQSQPVQYIPPPPQAQFQYAPPQPQPQPQMAWPAPAAAAPARAPLHGIMKTNTNTSARFQVSPKTVVLPHAAHKHKQSRTHRRSH